METRKVVILGSGCAGYTAGIYTARANLKPLLFAGLNIGGQLMITSDIENFPGFEDPIAGPELMERMRKQCLRLGIEIVQEDVAKVNLNQRPFLVETTEGKAVLAESLIIATGAKAKWLGIESETKLRGHGVSACATCDGFFFKGKEICVVGGGDTALEEASFLTNFGTRVTLIHRRGEFRASKAMQERVFRHPKIKVIWDSVVSEVLGDEEVSGVKIQNVKTQQFSNIPCQGLFIAIGHDPTSAIFKGQLDLDDKGYIVTDPRARTSVEGVFAAGDVADSVYRQAITAAGRGCMAALEAERWLAARESVHA